MKYVKDITKTDNTQLLVTTISVCKWVRDYYWRLQKLFLHESLVQSPQCKRGLSNLRLVGAKVKPYFGAKGELCMSLDLIHFFLS